MNACFTVGHSNQSLDAFLDTLASAEIETLVDVRRLPGSRAHPHFNAEVLQDALAKAGIEYRRVEALSGRRPKSRTVDPAVNGAWRNQSFHNYADYAMSTEFREGLDLLLDISGTVAIMCAEAVWWRCHRRIIADHLLARGETVHHLFPGGKIKAASLLPDAVVTNGSVTYPFRVNQKNPSG